MFDLGADGFMQDFGEEVIYDMHFADGETGVTMHNRYLILYARATRDEIARYTRTHPGRQLWFFDRAGYSGLPGTAAYDGGNFPGDETTDFSPASGLGSLDARHAEPRGRRGVRLRYRHRRLLRPGLAGDDQGAVPALGRVGRTQPLFRLHGSGLAGTHTPWSYDAQTVQVYNALSTLHQRAAPLIERLWRLADATGVPPTRPLWLGDPSRTAARYADRSGYSVPTSSSRRW